jgi:O-antigen ligase
MLFCGAVLLLLGCRSAFYSAVLGMFCLAWEQVRMTRTPGQRLVRRFLILIFILFAFTVILRTGFGNARLFEFTGENIDTGRAELWERARELIAKKPVFGGGFTYWEQSGNTMGTHNSFYTIMLFGGVTAGVLLVMMLCSIIYELYSENFFLLFAFMIQALLHSYTESGMDYYAYFPMIFAVILQRYLAYQDKDLRSVFY